jgi:hypothetical protein
MKCSWVVGENMEGEIVDISTQHLVVQRHTYLRFVLMEEVKVPFAGR